MATLTRLAHAQTRLGHFDQAAALLAQAELAQAEIPRVANPVVNASLRIEGVRILMLKVENSLAAKKPSEAVAPCEAVRAAIAAAQQEFTSPQLEEWDLAAKRTLEQLRK